MVLNSNRMFCTIKDVNNFTCNICFSKMCVYLCFSTPLFFSLLIFLLQYQPVYCSGSDAQTTMSQRREDLKAGDIRSRLAVWMADSPRAQERCQLAADTSKSWESFSAFLPVFLTFLPSLCCLFVFLCLHHPLTPSPRSYFLLPCSLLWTRISTLNSPSSVGVHRRRNTPPN